MERDFLSYEKIRRLQVIAWRKVNELFAGCYHSAFKGQGIEFEEVREYFPGDDFRTIDWNVTARFQRPFVKLFREERELTMTLIVDVSSSSQFGHGSQSKRELMAEMGALLAFSAIRNQDKVGLILFTNEVELYLKPKRGVRHILRVIRELLYFTPKQKTTDVSCALKFLMATQKKQCVVFLMSDFLNPCLEKEWMSLAAQKHEFNIFHVWDRTEEILPPLGLLTLQDLETGEIKIVDASDSQVRQSFSKKAREEQGKIKMLFSQLKIPYMTLTTDERADKALYRFFRLRQRKV